MKIDYILLQIFEKLHNSYNSDTWCISNTQELLELSLVSKQWRQLLEPFVYRTVLLFTDRLDIEPTWTICFKNKGHLIKKLFFYTHDELNRVNTSDIFWFELPMFLPNLKMLVFKKVIRKKKLLKFVV